MSRKDFWKVVLGSSLISSAIVIVLLQWPSPSPSQAETRTPESSMAVQPAQGLTDDERVNIGVYEQISPSVVNITSTTIEYTWFFEAVPSQGVGSGFIIDNDGHIVTNYHVIKEAKLLEVTLFDESVHEAEVVGLDPINDLAVLKIDCAGACRSVGLGSNDILRVGQKVLAIGNPFGLQQTLTTGIISSLGRTLKTEYGFVENVIQTDAAINPGNSGGPLLNAGGEVVGINTAIFSRSGDSAGIGFAVPVNTLKRILPDLLKHGKVIRPWFGVSRGRVLRQRLAKALKAPVEEGYLIETVQSGSSLDLAGIRGGNRRVYFGNSQLIIGGDILVEVGGRPIKTGYDILSALEDKKPGQEIEVVYYRENREIKTTMKLVGQDTGRAFRF